VCIKANKIELADFSPQQNGRLHVKTIFKVLLRIKEMRGVGEEKRLKDVTQLIIDFFPQKTNNLLC
jgi:hypothetical protein